MFVTLFSSLQGHCASEHGRYSLFLLCRAIVLLDTLVTLYFFLQGHCASGHARYSLFLFAGPLCFWTRSLLSISFLQGHCASGHARYSLFLFCRAIVPLDTVVTITSWTTCDSNPDDRSGMGTSILGT
ncbi:hypothetical protein L210DRAFT_3560408, partial [Boletus edulis BED1]